MPVQGTAVACSRVQGLHIGVVGVGRIGAFHVATLQALAGVSRITVADAQPGRAAAVARELGVGDADSPERLAAEVDALVIATATPGHVPTLRLAAATGRPAFCEKPVALDLAALDGVVADVENAGILVQVGFQRRFDAGYRAARDAVASGAVGTVLLVRAATHDPAPPPAEYIATSGGIFRDLQIHDFDAIRYVTGREIVEVYADGAVRESAWFADYGDVDAAVVVVRLDDGALGILSSTRRDPLGYDVRLEVLGTSDTITVGVDPAAPGAPRYRNFLDRFGPAYRAELAHFVDAAANGGDSPCTLRDARAALAAALAADRSRAERRPVAVAEVTGKSECEG